MEALGKSPLSQLKATFEDFVIGFNQASTQISMVDVGFGKEAADSKVKGVGSPLVFALVTNS